MAITFNGTNITFNDGTTQNTAAASWGTWQNVAASRAVGTTYTNSTGKPIQISIAVQLGPNATGYLNINGNQVNRGSNPFGDRSINLTQFFAIIPNGYTYAVTGFNGITFWWELR